MKICSNCKKNLDESLFHKQKLGKDGIRSTCKSCRSIDKKEYRAKNKEYINSKERERKKTERVRILRRASDKKYTKDLNVQIKRKARRMLRTEVDKGNIKRESCELCNNNKSEAHHDNYNYPLDVRWLCRKHHTEWHLNNTPIFDKE